MLPAKIIGRQQLLSEAARESLQAGEMCKSTVIPLRQIQGQMLHQLP